MIYPGPAAAAPEIRALAASKAIAMIAKHDRVPRSASRTSLLTRVGHS